MAMETEVLIIGGGVGGTSIARELSKYDVSVMLVEKEADVCFGATKGSCALFHPGVEWTPGTHAQSMIAESNQLMDQLAKELDVELKRLGEILLAFNEEEVESLKVMKKQGDHIHVPDLEIIDNAEIRRLEPNVNPSAIAALYMPTAGVVNPHDLTFAFYENAQQNGVRMLMATEVEKIIPENGRYVVETNQEEIHTNYIVNAAGLFAEDVAKMIGDSNFKVLLGKGSNWILDKRVGNLVNHIVKGLGDLKIFTRIKMVAPTFHGNIMIYRTIPEPAKGVDDVATERRIFDLTLESAKFLVPGVDYEKEVITSFAGVVATNNGADFILEPSEKYPTFINAALAAPGVTCSPAVGKRVVDILKRVGLNLEEKLNFNPYRQGMQRFTHASEKKKEELIRKDPRYGHVICRCETVTEGEVVEAIRRGARTLDGVKFRTRAGMGRCQAGFCGPRVTNILARELGQPYESITKRGRDSNYVLYKGKLL